MSYRWSLEGPAFEFPSPYGLENRFLELRGYVLIALAIGVALVLALVVGDDAARPVGLLDKLPEKASVWPHLLGALLMAVLGALNLVQASRQRTLLLTPGQPASLMPEVPHEASGSSSGAAWLMKAIERGLAMPAELTGPYLPWLRRLGDDLAFAPTTLHAYLRVRLARLALQGALVLLLALGALGALALGKPLALPAVALVVCLVGVAVLARHLMYPAQAAPGPLVITAVLALAVAVALPLAWFADTLPGASWWPRLGLPAAACAMLALGLAFEVLGLLAARAQVVAPRGTPTEGESVTVSFGDEPGHLIGDVDRELQRRWTEGVPNRRYARVPPLIDPAAEEGGFNATVLEESQPTALGAKRGAVPAQASSPAAKSPSLMLLEWLGLGSSVCGGLLWLWLARAHMIDATASWLPATVGLVCLLAGGYVRRIAHVLWSRVEVESAFIWLDFAGDYYRVVGSAAAAGAAGRSPKDGDNGVEGLTLTARVSKARSVFYAAAPFGAGSRALLSLDGDPAAAGNWIALVQAAERHAGSGAAAAESPALRAARARSRERHGSGAQAAAPAQGPARFCSACGAPLLVGGRFCQQCGKALHAD